MSAKLMTIGEVAEKLSNVDGQASANYLARQIRTFVQRRTLEPVGYIGEGRTAASGFDDTGLCEARLLTVLARLGLSPEQLYSAHRCMKNVDEDIAGKGPMKIGLPRIVDHVKEGRRWYFVFHLVDEKYDLDRSFGIFTETPTFSDHLISGLTLASVVLDCSVLFRGLIDIKETA